MKHLTPALFLCLKDYSKDKFVKDLISGIIVAIIALPLSIALALASGVTPEQGLYTAIVAGFVISFFGGSTVQIAGPTAAFATIVAGVVAKSGMEGLVVATVLAGIMLILMGILRMGSMIKFIPDPITVGFTAGIALTIVIGQIKDFLGLTFTHSPVETMEKVEETVNCIGTLNPMALVVGLVALDTRRDADSKKGWIGFLYLLPEHRGKRYGVQLLGYATTLYTRLGRKAICLNVSEDNPHAQGFYRHTGFRQVGEAIGVGAPLLLMERPLGRGVLPRS